MNVKPFKEFKKKSTEKRSNYLKKKDRNKIELLKNRKIS